MRKKLVDRVRRECKAFAALLACALVYILVVLFLEVVIGWEHKVADLVAFAFILFLFVFGYLLPIEAGVRYRHKTK